MKRHLNSRSLERSQWFSDVTAALGEAERLLRLLEADRSLPVETARLRTRVQTLRSEIELLNRVVLSEDRVVGAPWPATGNGGR